MNPLLATYKPYGSHAGAQITLPRRACSQLYVVCSDTLSSQNYKQVESKRIEKATPHRVTKK